MNHVHVQLCMPAGPLGAIVKPLEWRKNNDSKRFIKDWLEFINPLKIRRRCIMSVQQWYWEREKNEMRKLWYGLSKYEQDRYFSMRDVDGTISNVIVQMMKDFKGPKYQQGSISMMAGGGMLAAGGATLALSTGNNSAFNIDVSPPGALDAGYGVIRDGTHDRTNSSGISQINSAGDWVTPRTSTVGDDYEVKWNQLTGTAMNDENYTEDVWTTINVTGLGRYVGHSTSAPAIARTFEIDIGDVGTSTSDINQDYFVECGDLV